MKTSLQKIIGYTAVTTALVFTTVTFTPTTQAYFWNSESEVVKDQNKDAETSYFKQLIEKFKKRIADREQALEGGTAELKKDKKGDWSKMDKEEKGDHNILDQVELQDLSDLEKEHLIYSYREEALARDVYAYLYETYNNEVFNKISGSEQQHLNAVQRLLDRYEIALPSGYGVLQETYDSLIAKGSLSLQDALEVGMSIEILDIEDLVKMMKEIDNDDIKIVFSNIGGASYNHLKAFINELKSNNLPVVQDYSAYLSEADFNKKGWELKENIFEKLEKAGVVLPELAKKSHEGKGEMHKGGKNMQENESQESFEKEDHARRGEGRGQGGQGGRGGQQNK